MSRVYLVGIGPGSSEYITLKAKSTIESSDIIVGYKHTIDSIKRLITLDEKDVRLVTLKTQDSVYNSIVEELIRDELSCSILFTGDVNFSESEIVDKLVNTFSRHGIDVILIPGISSIQVAAAYSRIAIDKAVIITFHITGSIDYEKEVLLNALRNGKDVILLPRPWDFMPYHISKFLELNRVDVNLYITEIYENLTLSNEKVTKCMLNEVKDIQYSDLCVMVIKRKRYIGNSNIS